jgi:glycolate oxidase iron-sulfur subunit
LSQKLSKLQYLSPRIDTHFFDDEFPELNKPKSKPIYRVGMLSGCLMNVAFANINRDTLKVLLYHDCEVIIPKEQVCCGSIQGHHGDFERARILARKNIDLFLNYNIDAVIVNSSGCGAYMKEYGHLLRDDAEYSQKAKILSSLVKDFSEFVYDIGFKKPQQTFPHSVTYQDACHLVHTQKISRQPREILKSIPGIKFIEMNESTWCCGSAGLYNVIRYYDSMQILNRKVKNIISTYAEYVIANNHGCILQMKKGCVDENINSEVIHLASLLAKLYD